MRKKNVFVVGMNDLNRERLQTLPHAEHYDFHALLTYEESHGAAEYRPKELMQKATGILDRFDGPVDAIIGFWDFPVSPMIPLLAARYGTRSASLASVLRAEHKYWARLKQREVIPEHTPEFVRFDPFDDDALSRIGMSYPFWIKPMIAFGGHLGLKVENEDDFRKGVQEMRKNIHRFAEPFKYFASQLEDGDDYPGDEGGFAIAEQIISGRQCTVEGYVSNGKVEAHGVIDSFCFPGTTSFSRLEYPSKLPQPVKDEMIEASRKIISHLEYDNSTFNIEYFYDEPNDRIWLLEINARISQSHSDLFYKVDGHPNQELLVSTALGQDPTWPRQEGAYKVAAKFFLRRFADGQVVRCPTVQQVHRVKELVPETVVELLVKPDMWLHDLGYQDSYSYKLAILYIGAEDDDELMRKYHQCVGELDFAIREKEDETPAPFMEET